MGGGDERETKKMTPDETNGKARTIAKFVKKDINTAMKRERREVQNNVDMDRVMDFRRRERRARQSSACGSFPHLTPNAESLAPCPRPLPYSYLSTAVATTHDLKYPFRTSPNGHARENPYHVLYYCTVS